MKIYIRAIRYKLILQYFKGLIESSFLPKYAIINYKINPFHSLKAKSFHLVEIKNLLSG